MSLNELMKEYVPNLDFTVEEKSDTFFTSSGPMKILTESNTRESDEVEEFLFF